ncbi:hypothetical protein HDU98_001846 [Podochytrium sp. JEL0797]|nr:hypothetical protein HDU98_001846 [Podochytrium sp. JEL0797]
MVQPEVPAYIVGGLCAVGGTIGFVKGKSVPSLVAGMTCAGIYAFAGSRIAAKASYGAEIAVAVSLLLLVMMGKKAVLSQKPVPVIMSTLGLISSIFYLSVIYAAKKAKAE